MLQAFDFIFPVIFVWALVFAILQKTQATGGKITIDAVIAAVAGFMILLSQEIVDLINFMIPWFTVAIIFFVLLLLLFRIFGASENDITKALKADRSITWVLIAIGLIIVFAGIGNVLGQQYTEAAFDGQPADQAAVQTGVATTNFQENVRSILSNPKVLGMVVLFGIVIFAIALLSGSPT